VNKSLAWGLFGAWAIHDAEEWLTIGAWRARQTTRVGPRGIGRRLSSVSVWHFRAAISMMSVLVAAVAAQGARTNGRSLLFQAGLAGFGLHGFGHIGFSVATRSYTPGVVTAQLVVIPFSGWAWSQLGQQRIRHSTPATVAAAVPVTAGALAVAHAAAAMMSIIARRPASRTSAIPVGGPPTLQS
jgi:hypothetical protein